MKKWYASKTIWVNVLAAICLAVQAKTGFVIDAEAQAAILIVVNLILRGMTKEAVTLALLLSLGGCSFSPSADVIKAMGEDPASVCVRMRATYMAASGDVLVARTNITSGTMKCNADGITVTPSDTTEVQVPQKNITVQPKP